MEEDAKGFSFDSGNPLLSINPAKEYLFGELSSADLRWLLTPSSKSVLAGSCEARSVPCNLHFERKEDYHLGLRDQVALLDTEEMETGE